MRQLYSPYVLYLLLLSKRWSICALVFYSSRCGSEYYFLCLILFYLCHTLCFLFRFALRSCGWVLNRIGGPNVEGIILRLSHAEWAVLQLFTCTLFCDRFVTDTNLKLKGPWRTTSSSNSDSVSAHWIYFAVFFVIFGLNNTQSPKKYPSRHCRGCSDTNLAIIGLVHRLSYCRLCTLLNDWRNIYQWMYNSILE